MSKVIFGDVVRRANTKEDRHNTDKIYYVGGEHIESNEVLIENRGLIEGSNIGRFISDIFLLFTGKRFQELS